MRSDLFWASLGLVVCASCSLARTDLLQCSPETCREAFGVGSICGDDGFCTEAEPQPRCARSYPEDYLLRPEIYPGALVIGSLFDRRLATHRARENSIRLALQGANDQGGLQRRQFAVVYCDIAEDARLDPLSRTEAAVAMADHLIEVFAVKALIGPAASDDVLAVADAVQGRDVIVISPSATSPALTAIEPEASDAAPGMIWRTAPPDSLQGRAIAKAMVDGLGGVASTSTAAVIFEAGAYGEFLAQEFRTRFESLGGRATLYRYDNQAQLDEALLEAVAEPDVEEVLFVSSQSQDVVSFLTTADVAPGYAGVRLFVTDSGANVDVVEDASASVLDRLRGTRQAPLDPEQDFVFQLFLIAYENQYGESAEQYSFTANAYDAAWLVTYGMAWAAFQGSGPEPFPLRGMDIARGLRHLSSGLPYEIRPTNWIPIRERLREGQGVDVEGASSALDFDPTDEEIAAPIETWVVRNGDIVGIGVEEP